MPSERVPRRLRRQVGDRAQWRCEYCLSSAAFSTQPFQVDHIVPQSKGGPTILENLALSCGCNGYKGDSTHARDPQTGRIARLFNPRRQRWTRHFGWSEDFLRIVGRTATGRATAGVLLLNRPELINLRRLLLLIGEHPPREE
ncbi:MAG TPA: HNH endonuclease signature motif containing protein [Gemmataceae bacterium]|jgi:5-methylcytosine-specific restriction endonuclease McrA|nr:HNH endonuclease signature motif containing protein [Gemmataceae bacterium]